MLIKRASGLLANVLAGYEIESERMVLGFNVMSFFYKVMMSMIRVNRLSSSELESHLLPWMIQQR